MSIQLPESEIELTLSNEDDQIKMLDNSSSPSPDDLKRCTRPLIGFLLICFGLGMISDLNYLYPNIYFLKLISLIIAITVLTNLTIIETFILDCDHFGFMKILGFNCTTYTFGLIAYYSLLNIYHESYPLLDGLCYFAIANVIYFTGEFIFVCIYQIHKLRWSSFLINYSMTYFLAIFFSIIEYGLETKYSIVPKHNKYVIVAGGVILFIGFIFRTGTFISGREHLNHVFEEYRKPDQLVKSGLFSISRYPSYLGWFLFTVGGQVVLTNPICLMIFTIISLRFFYNRIKFEEYTMLSYFGSEYQDYYKRTPILIPFMETCLRRHKIIQ